jgi:DNA-directed RNA polymerase specialized sigma24 family protein
MARSREISQQNFKNLLIRLDQDQDAAAQKYEKIRFRLIKIFTARGCPIADELADETIDRVTEKIDQLKETYEGDRALYFYAVGKNVLSEYFRKPVAEELSPTLAQDDGQEEDSDRLKCLRTCLQTLTNDQSLLILSYYEKEKNAKIEQRKVLAERLGVSSEVLRIKIFRLKSSLQKCVERCLEKKTVTF